MPYQSVKRLFVTLCAAGLLASAAQAGLFRDSVDLADLSELSVESLQSLRDSEFAVFLAQVSLQAARAAERRAAGGVKAANRTLEAENLDMKAAQAEARAAKANQDADRLTVATALVASAEEDLKTAKAFRKWKVQEQDAREAEVAAAKSALDLAEARRDAARVRLLSQSDVPSRAKYDLGDFERNVTKRQKEYETSSRKARDKLAKLEQLKVDWDRLAKNPALPETE